MVPIESHPRHRKKGPILPAPLDEGFAPPPLADPIYVNPHQVMPPNTTTPQITNSSEEELPTSVVTKKPGSNKDPAQLGQIQIEMDRL